MRPYKHLFLVFIDHLVMFQSTTTFRFMLFVLFMLMLMLLLLLLFVVAITNMLRNFFFSDINAYLAAVRGNDDVAGFERLVEVSATNGAGFVRAEPEVDAVLVEDMAAEGQEAEQAVILKLHQTDGAFQAVLLILPELLHGGVGEGGEDLQQRRVKASRRRSMGRETNDGTRSGALKGPGLDHAGETVFAQVNDAERHEAHHQHTQREGDQRWWGVVRRRHRRRVVLQRRHCPEEERVVEFAGEWVIPGLLFLVVCMDERSWRPCKAWKTNFPIVR